MDGNFLEIFKDQDPRMQDYANGGPLRILFMQRCAAVNHKRDSFTAYHINDIFTQGINPENLQEKIVALLAALQGYYHGKRDWCTYPHASKEYPKRYEALLEGLSQEALDKMKMIDVTQFSTKLKADTARAFCTRFEQDKTSYAPNNTATLEMNGLAVSI